MECPKCGKTLDGTESPCSGCGWDGSAATVDSGIIEQLWGKTLTPDMEPGMTIKSEPSSSVSRSGVSVKEKNLSPADSPEVPDSDYELISLLGEGGMGVVYTARQASMDRTVALKMIQSGTAFTEGARNKFISEAAVTGDLDHPNIVPVYDLGSDRDGALFYAMKHVKGTPWSKMIRNYLLNRNLEILMRTADAVAFAHSKGIIHRDLKPENVMIGDFGEVLVMDWGLAASVKENGKADYIRGTAGIGGTPSYMSPEMAMGEIELIDQRSDVYLLGAILFEIITGRAPHSGENMRACLMAAANNEIISVEEKGELLDIALKSMRSDPAERFESVKSFQDAIRKYQEHSESIEMSARAEQTLKKAQETMEYTEYSRALFGFTEAQGLWEENENARRGKSETEIAYAECALGRGDLDLAISLVDENNPDHTRIRENVLRAQAERESRKKRLRLFRWATGFLTAAVLLLIAGAWVYVEMEKQKIRDEAAELARLGEKVLQESSDAETPDQREKLLIEAQNLFRQSLFLDPENVESKHGFRDSSVDHYLVALENKNWKQAREKLDQAYQTGMQQEEYADKLKQLENAENARKKHIEERVSTLIADAASLPRTVLHRAAMLELISLKDRITVDALLPHVSHENPEAQKLAIETLGYLGDLRAVHAILPYIENFTPDNKPIPRSVQESSIMALAVLAPEDKAVFEAIRTRYKREPGERDSLLYRNTREYFAPYAGKMGEKLKLEFEKEKKGISAEQWKDLGDIFRYANSGNALDYFKKAIELKPSDDELYFYCAKIYGNAGKYEEASSEFKMAISHNPDSWKALSGLAYIQMRTDKMEEAKANNTKALACVPETGAAFGRSEILTLMGQISTSDKSAAMEYYNQAVSLCPDYTGVREKRIDLLINMDDYTRAREECSALLDINPRSYMAYILLGKIDYKRKNFDDAELHFKKAVELNPNYYYTHTYLAGLYIWTEEYEQSVDEMTKAIALGPGGIWKAYNLWTRGKARIETGDWEGALKDFIEAGELDPTLVPANTKAGFILNAFERTREAYTYLKKALGYVKVSKDTRADVMLETAKMRLAQGSYTGAIRDAASFLRMSRQDYIPHFIIGTALAIQGKENDSLDNLRKALAYIKRDRQYRIIFPVIQAVIEHIPEMPAIKKYESDTVSDPEQLLKRGLFFAVTCRSFSAEKDLRKYLENVADIEDDLGFRMLYYALLLRNDYPDMRETLEMWIKAFPGSTDARVLYSDILCESPLKHFRNPQKALKIAESLAEETEYTDSDVLASLAIALAANLKFKDAMDIMEQSIDKCRRDLSGIRTERMKKLERYTSQWNKRREISEEELKDI